MLDPWKRVHKRLQGCRGRDAVPEKREVELPPLGTALAPPRRLGNSVLTHRLQFQKKNLVFKRVSSIVHVNGALDRVHRELVHPVDARVQRMLLRLRGVPRDLRPRESKEPVPRTTWPRPSAQVERSEISRA